VTVATAERRDLPVYFTGLGTVQAFNTVTVKTRVDGELLKVAFTERQGAKAGDLLAQIGSRPFQSTLDHDKWPAERLESLTLEVHRTVVNSRTP
jgi:multidrug efflux system membrane fusion protein